MNQPVNPKNLPGFLTDKYNDKQRVEVLNAWTSSFSFEEFCALIDATSDSQHSRIETWYWLENLPF